MSFLSNVLTLFPKGLDHVEVDDVLNYSTEDVQHFDEVINTYNGTQQLNSRLREVIDNELLSTSHSALCQLQWAACPMTFASPYIMHSRRIYSICPIALNGRD